ncbi:hypothetical protein HPP92_002524 [Vanilla planifolia]|uniref:Cytochrome P450 n=1 Tax=Vanilla planifolia TaxID=51239 RepID=A0A835RW20_VANPL|nr:hypothetical protein HPP92_002524 [Vanilla planifolia]
MASKMIRQHDGFDGSSPFGNPLRFIFPKGSHSTSKLISLQSSFDQTFADNLTRLKPGDTCNFPTLSWMRRAIDSLFENHKLVKNLVADLEYPSTLWDEKWIEFFLYDSVKFLDVCIALISEVSRLEQQQILLRYALQLLDFSCPASPEQLQRATGALFDWMQKLDLRSPKLKDAPVFLQSLEGTLHFPKVKNSSKGKVVMRAMYAMKIHMIFVSSVLLLILSGCSKPLVNLQIPNDLPWAKAFDELQALVKTELEKSSIVMPKELLRVDASSRHLHVSTTEVEQMAMESWGWLLFRKLLVFLASLGIPFLIEHLCRRGGTKGRTKPALPPSASPFPFLCHLVQHRGSLAGVPILLRRFHSLYGPIFSLRLLPFSKPSIFISDASLAHSALVCHAEVFSDRPPPVEPARFLTARSHDISSANSGPLWLLLRRNLESEILHTSRLRLFAPARQFALRQLLDNLRGQFNGDVVAKETFNPAILSIFSSICFGQKLADTVVSEIESLQAFLLGLFTSFNVFAVFPALTKLLFHKKWKEIISARRRQMEIFLPLIRARQTRKQSISGVDYQYCYVDSLLDLRLPSEGGRGLSDDETVNLCHEFLSGAATTATAMEWTMAELVKRPGLQSNLSVEIESVARSAGEALEEEDFLRMPYLQALIMESLRRHPPSHFVLPHSVTEDIHFKGFLIPKGAEVHFAVADVNWNEKKWEEPMEFRPERFMAEGGFDLTGNVEIKMMTFGAGIRMCPGYGLAILLLQFLVANLVRELDWKPVEEDRVDLSEKLDFTTVMKNPLRVRVLPRKQTGTKFITFFFFYLTLVC